MPGMSIYQVPSGQHETRWYASFQRWLSFYSLLEFNSHLSCDKLIDATLKKNKKISSFKYENRTRRYSPPEVGFRIVELSKFDNALSVGKFGDDRNLDTFPPIFDVTYPFTHTHAHTHTHTHAGCYNAWRRSPPKKRNRKSTRRGKREKIKKGCSHPHEILYSRLLTPESGKLASPRAVSRAAWRSQVL